MGKPAPQAWCDAYAAGATLRQLCADHGVKSLATMKRRLETAGVVMRPAGKVARSADDPIVLRAKAMRAENKTLGQIAARLGLKSRSGAHRLLRSGGGG